MQPRITGTGTGTGTGRAATGGQEYAVVKFEHAESVPNDSILMTDVCVVGSGAAGITVAQQLAGTPRDVLVLEAGGMEQDASTEADCFAIEHVGVPYANPIPTRGRWFGGSTNLWFGRIAMIAPIDMEQRSWVPHSGWPIRYSDLQRWTARAASILDVPHFDKISIQNWPKHPTIDTFASDAGAGLEVFLWANGMFMGQRHAEALRAARNVRLLLESTVVELVPSADGATIERVSVRGSGGNSFQVCARTVVLAAGGLENPRILLASRSRSPSGVGNAEDRVGRYYMDHPKGEGLARVDLRGLAPDQLARVALLGEKSKSAYGKVQLRVTFTPELQRSEGLLNHSLHAHLISDVHESPGFLSARRLVQRLKSRSLGDARELKSDLEAAVKGSPAIARYAAQKLLGTPTPSQLIVIDQMEQEPDPESRVTLDSQRCDGRGLPRLRLDWRIGESTYRSQVRMHRLFKEVLERAGIGGFQSDVLDRPSERPTLIEMKHPTGTTRMSTSPKHGVVDADCKVHGVSNLYLTGSSVFPTAGHFNPTLVIVALAARLAEHIKAL